MNCICPILYPIIYSRQDEYKLIKAVAGFFYGTLLGLGKWNNVKVFLHRNKNLFGLEPWRIRKLKCDVMQYISNTHGNLWVLYCNS